MKRTNPTIALMLWLTAAYTASFIGMQGALRGLEAYYPSLHRPAWSPPLGLFAPLWTLLYALMGVAIWRVWKTEGSSRAAFAFWSVQITLNALWPWLFFAWGKLGAAFGEVVLLWFAILTTTLLFARKDRIAAWLLVPSLAWIAYAALLNFAIWRTN